MKFNVILGESFVDITKTQIAMIGQGIKSGRKQLVIVPDRFALTMENQILQELNITATFDLDVVSFARLSSKLLSTSDNQTLSSLGASMVIEMILLQQEKNLKCFKNTAKTIAFASVIFDSISQLKSCNILPQDLFNSLESIKNDSLKLKLFDIAIIYEKYEEYLAQGFVDSNNRLDLLCQAIEENQDFINYDIHFCNFSSITQKGLDLLKMFTKRANSVNFGVVMPNEDCNNAEMFNTEVYDSILPLIKNLNIKPSFFEAGSHLNKYQSHILRNVMAIKPGVMPLQDDSYLNAYCASGINQEVEWIANDIMHKVRNGARFRDIMINTANIEIYTPIIKRVFSQYSIPFWADVSVGLQDTEGFKIILAAIDCVQDYFQSKDILRFVKNSLSGIDASKIEVFENVLNKYNLYGALFLKDIKPANEDEDFEIFLDVKRNLQPLFTLQKNVQSSTTISDFIIGLNTFIQEIDLKNKLDNQTIYYLDKNDLYRSSIARQNFAKIDNILCQMKDIMGQFECNFTEFNKILKVGVSSVNISPLPMSLDCVFVGQNLQSVFTTVEHYYILGAVEGELPSWVKDVGLIVDGDIKSLRDLDVSISPTIRQVNARSRFMTLQNLCLGNKSLTISYPKIRGQDECKPADCANSILSSFSNNGNQVNWTVLSYMLNDDASFQGQKNRIARVYDNPHKLIHGLVESIGNKSIDKSVIATIRQTLKENGYSDLLEQMSKIKQNKTTVQNLTNPQGLFFKSNKAGVTQIERFFECPYQHFLTYGLKLKKKDSARIEAVDVGNILHAILEKFGLLLKYKGVQEDKYIQGISNQLFEEVIHSKDFEYITFSGHNETFLLNLKAEAVLICRAINYQLQHSKYKITFVEAKFGDKNFIPVPEIAIINTDKKIKISGKIDRVDVFGNKLRIIDYKTSKHSAEFGLVNFYLGKKIQLFYYLNTILDGLNMSPGGAYYLPVHKEYLTDEPKTPFSRYCMQGVVLDDTANLLLQDDQINYDNPSSDIVKASISTSQANIDSGIIAFNKRVGIVASEKQFKNLLKYAKEVLKNAINDIYIGVIKPLYIKDACTYCPYIQICRVGVLVEKTPREENFNVELDTFNFEEE